MTLRKLLPFFLLIGLLSSCGGPKGPRVALIETEFGNIKVQLYDETPQHRDNFVKLVEAGFYDELLFHRVIKNFMIQGGDPDSKGAAAGELLGQGGPGYTIPAEIIREKIHTRGKLCAARLGNPQNPEKESSGSQFYIVQGFPIKDFMLDKMEETLPIKYTEEERQAYYANGGAPNLDTEYTIFGETIEGMDVVDKIANLETDNNARPVKDIKMKIRMLN
ncbi:MAG: peptidylprolyl isomerase [Phaeodactylibacter sp.]|nr:peptidylprolyl isomerase [Phaeodactylibacter sp.]